MEASREAVAAKLGLRIVAQLAGGEFGASLVENSAGRRLVFKVIASDALANRVALGARMAERMRIGGYPAPEYAGTGSFSGVTWSLQSVLPGQIPDIFERRFAEQLLDLAEQHADSAGETGDWHLAALRNAYRMLGNIEGEPGMESLVRDAGRVLETAASLGLRTGDVVHGDFHHRNFFALGELVSGVFDWELSSPGDWRFDVATLAFWSKVVPTQIPASVAAFVEERLRAVAGSDVVAFFAICMALNVAEFNSRLHRERLPGLLQILREQIAPWWQVLL